MSKHFFIKFVTSPDVDPLKCFVGLGCAAQAINDGHKVDIFFAAGAVQLLHTNCVSKLNEAIDAPSGMYLSFIDTIKMGQMEFIVQLNHKHTLELVRNPPKLLLKA